jgi:two-component system sensor histidine kinase FlrB
MALSHLQSVQQISDTRRDNDGAKALELAFKAFNEISGELSQSYQVLENRVRELTHELEAANVQRLRELSEKERIARRLQKLLQLLPGGVLVLNGKGVVSECNEAAITLLGEPLTGLPWVNIIRDRFAPRSDDGHEISLVNGKRVSLLSRSLEEEPGQIILITDQTETRRLQQHLSRHQRLLEMGKMVSSLAHQIRTPLSAAMLYAGNLSTSLAGDQSRNIRTHERLMSRLHNMERQVRDMLIFARGEAVLDETLSIHQILEEARVAADVMLCPDSRQDALSCEWINIISDCQLSCNKESLIGALLNLLENAIQNAGPTVELQVRADRADEQGLIRLYVQDNGPGIEPAALAQVTEAFFTTRAQGTGLGLAVAQVVARAHGGQFFIENIADNQSGTGQTGVRAGFILPCVHKFPQPSTTGSSK